MSPSRPDNAATSIGSPASPTGESPATAALSERQRARLGVRHMLASAFFFSVMGLLVKAAGERLPSSQLVLVRAFICLFLSWIWLRRAGIAPWGSNPRVLILRGVFGTVALICFYYTLVTLPLAESSVIAHTSPIVTAALAALLLDEPVSPRLVGAIVCCAAGVVAIARPAVVFGGASPFPTDSLDSWGVAIGFAGALCSSCVYVLIRRIRERENPLVMVFYFPLVTVPLVLPFAATRWLWPTPVEWLMLIGLGVSTQLAQVGMTRGLMLLPAGRATAINYVQVVLAALWGALFFGEVPDLLTLGGAALILGATLSLTLPGFRRRDGDEDGIVAG
jgi:drug/metabolite transporter (DMT)-like permease